MASIGRKWPDTVKALVISPLTGFIVAALLLLAAKALVAKSSAVQAPEGTPAAALDSRLLVLTARALVSRTVQRRSEGNGN